MGKRKRDKVERGSPIHSPMGDVKKKKVLPGSKDSSAVPVTIQIVIGTYEKVLHGVTATITGKVVESTDQTPEVEFADTFLLSPHGAAIRCLAISPPSSSDTAKSQKLILASGSSDQIVNLYHISAIAPPRQRPKGPPMPTLSGNRIAQNPKNRELGSLQHHSAGINALHFPTRSKLLSAADDNTIAVARTRDWTVLSTIKAPIPKAHGRPSGDTAPLGGTPAGVNDFAIHPSMKLMVSVGKGEKCMRLWNLVTGKKAGVLNFEKDLLKGIGEGRWASGEGRRVAWNSLGEEFVVGFERGCVVFGMDSKPKCRILPSPATKIHQLHYITLSEDDKTINDVLAVSTEDGRILFYSTTRFSQSGSSASGSKTDIPLCTSIGQLGGAAEGVTSRIKDFEILRLPGSQSLFAVTGSSDGAIRLWVLDDAEVTDGSLVLVGSKDNDVHGSENAGAASPSNDSAMTTQVGSLLGTYEAGNRITCLKAFIMSQPESTKPNGLVDGNTNRANCRGGNDQSSDTGD